MLMKWIVCEVSPDQQAAFSEAQQAWSALSGAPGFLGQLGGWDQAGRACVVGFWQDAAHYRRFMATLHDPIVDASGQANTITSCSVRLSEPLEDIRASLLRADGPVHIAGHVVTLEEAWRVA